MKFGINLYGPMCAAKDGLPALLGRIAAMGYGGVEPCISLGAPIPAFLTRKELRDTLPLMDELGLACNSCHVNAPDVRAALPNLMDLAETCHLQQIVLWCPSGLDAAAYHDKALALRAAAETLCGQGTALLLHNGWPDIAEKCDGISVYEWMIRACEGLVGMQFDTGRSLFGGEEPVAFLRRHEHDVLSLHLKDVRGTRKDGTNPDTSNVCVGTGLVNSSDCFAWAWARDIPQLIDQDMAGDGLEQDMAQGCAWLTALAGQMPAEGAR